MATTPFVPTSKYYVLTPSGDNLDFLDFNLSYGNASITDRGEHIQYNGSATIDSVFVRPGLTYDLTNTGPRTDKIYLSGNLGDYSRSAADGVLILWRTVDTLIAAGQYEEVRIAGGSSFNFDNLVFANGVVNANTLYNDVLNGLPLPTPDPSETSVNPQGAARPGAPLSATIKAYSTNTAGVGQVGETFASVKAGMSLTINGGNGIDSAYVADGETLDATVTGASVDLIYMRGNWADYAKRIIPGTNTLELTRVINGNLETVTVNAGTAFNYDRLIFADGAITTIAAKQTTDPGFVGPVVLDPGTKTPLYTDEEVQTALNAIRDAAQGNSAGTDTPTALTYHIAGVSGVDASNLASINSALDTGYVTGARADTAPEIQTIVNAYRAILAEANGAAANPNPALSATPYTDIGVTGVSGTAGAGNALFLLDDVVDNSPAAAVDTVPEIQAMADAAARVIAAAGGTPAQAAAITQNDLTNLGITGVGPDNIAAVQAAIQHSAANAVDTQAEIQALVTLLPPAAPTINVVAGDDIINLSEVGSTITGTNQVGDSVTLTIAGLAHAATVTGGTWSYMLQPVDIFLMGQGPETISATQTNANHVTSTAATRNISVDTIPPTATLTPGTLAPTASATVQSSEIGTAYLVNSSLAVTDLSSITSAADNLWNSVPITAANSNTSLPLTGLQDGTYLLYTVDAAGNLSAPSSANLGVTPSITPPPPPPVGPISINNIVAGIGGLVINLDAGLNNVGFDKTIHVSYVGDVNGDGLSDMLLQPGNDSTSGNDPAGYVVFGKTDHNPINLAAVTAGTGGFIIGPLPGGVGDSYFASAISGVGDINGDGLADLIVGIPGFYPDVGTSYVIYGKSNGAPVTLAAVAAGNGGFGITNATGYNNEGTSVSSAGDVNGDGLSDILVANGSSTAKGNTYVVYGKAGNAPVSLDAVAAGFGGYVININPVDATYGRVLGVGDVNGDGLADQVVYSDGPFGGANTGKEYVVFGKTGNEAVNLSSVADGIGGYVIYHAIGDTLGRPHLAALGDVNGDGLADFAEASYGGDTGVTYVVFGKASTTALHMDAIAAGAGGFAIYGMHQPNGAPDESGYSIASAGDLNGDGLGDIILGVAGSNYTGGASYVVFGKTNTNAVQESELLAGSGGFAIQGAANGGITHTDVSSAGDVNGDGFSDLIVTAPYANGGVGAAYIILGGTQIASTVDFLGSATLHNLTGTSASETFVAGAGNNTMTGNGGADVMYGGAGNDTFVLNTSNTLALQSPMGSGGNFTQLSRINGGTGIDTIQLTSGANLDLTQVANQAAAVVGDLSRISSIEVINLKTDGHANTLSLRANDVIDMSGMDVFNSSNTSGMAAIVSKHQVAVFGDASDTLNIGASNWTNTGSVVSYGGHSLVVYNSNTSAAQLLVEQAMVTASHVI